jgi:hypothetical protein
LWDLNPLPSVLIPMTLSTALPSSLLLSGCLFLMYPMSSDLLSIKSHFTDILTFVGIEPTTISFWHRWLEPLHHRLSLTFFYISETNCFLSTSPFPLLRWFQQ